MLNDLTPAELRKKIEELLAMTDTPKVGQIVGVLDTDLRDLCRLALAAVPKIEWVEEGEPVEFRAQWGGFKLFAWHELNRPDMGCWALQAGDEVLSEGTAPTLKAAQAAAEAALLKLIGGGE